MKARLEAEYQAMGEEAKAQALWEAHQESEEFHDAITFNDLDVDDPVALLAEVATNTPIQRAKAAAAHRRQGNLPRALARGRR